MHSNNRHPTRKCSKCKLNFRTYCGLFDNPHQQWHERRKCPGYMSESHYQQYLCHQQTASEVQQSKPGMFARRKAAKLRKTTAHYDGVVKIGKKKPADRP